MSPRLTDRLHESRISLKGEHSMSRRRGQRKGEEYS